MSPILKNTTTTRRPRKKKEAEHVASSDDEENGAADTNRRHRESLAENVSQEMMGHAFRQKSWRGGSGV